jgi:1-acyl-sn-glycerol-3-phosphate acyltransferase
MKLALRIIHTIIFDLTAIALFFVGAALSLLFVPFFRKRYRPFQFTARVWAKILMRMSGSKVTIQGLSNIPKKGGYIFASNHQGAFDILITLAYIPRYFRFIAKKELFNIPLFGLYMKLAGYVPIDRDAASSAHRTIGGIADVLMKKECILIYPEGTRSKTGELGAFKRGSLMAAFQSGASVIPVAISGSHKMLPKRSFLIDPADIKISFGKSMDLSGYKGKKAAKEDYEKELGVLRNDIQGMLNE